MGRRWAPVQGGQVNRDVRPIQDGALPAGQVPWAVHALAMEEYNRHHTQSAERMAERAGLSWGELVAALRGEYTMAGVQRAHDDIKRVFDAALAAGRPAEPAVSDE